MKVIIRRSAFHRELFVVYPDKELFLHKNKGWIPYLESQSSYFKSIREAIGFIKKFDPKIYKTDITKP